MSFSLTLGREEHLKNKLMNRFYLEQQITYYNRPLAETCKADGDNLIICQQIALLLCSYAARKI
jgi:hypothetical protein